MELLAYICRLGLGAVFLMAALPKLGMRQKFIETVQGYKILPRALARAYGLTLPWFELVAAALLLIGVLAEIAAAAVILLLTSFMIAVGVAMWRRTNLECSCFGLLYRERVGWSTQIRDAVLLVMTVPIFLAEEPVSLHYLLANLSHPAEAALLVIMSSTILVSSAVALVSLRVQRRFSITPPSP